MKKTIITLSIVCFAIGYSFGQLKGDNFIGLNFGTQKINLESNQQTNEIGYNYFGINYSHFVNDNRRLNFGVAYNQNKSSYNSNNTDIKDDIKGYSFSVGYGMLFPLLKNFYAELTPNLYYSFQESGLQSSSDTKINVYAANINGGILWVPFKHFGISANLASLSLSYNKNKTIENFNNQENISESSTFSFNNQGSLQNQSFSIFYKF
ncbi:hypothetical protein [Pedobacter alpinus]|uniref:Outer membrane protein beta-barrel domain-containing protein n=1 Tax=Pedobacter alpinus TaxID=1590643 RepID=A0ABW5TQ14_9SPHI